MAEKTTEADSRYNDLERMSVQELLSNMNREDATIASVVQGAIPAIEPLIQKAVDNMNQGGRLFYLGAGTSGRLGILDASECPPTYGVEHGLVIGLIAGGDSAIRKAVENAEDDHEGGWKDLQEYQVNQKDTVIGIAASGTTPYVIGALKHCNEHGITTGCITCNSGSPLAQTAQFPIEVVVGPEFVTGSTRMKAGTAQKLVLNMISTSIMIQRGRVQGNKMVDMHLSNNKLVDRGTKMVAQQLNILPSEASALLKQHGSVRAAVDSYRNQ